MEMKQFVDAKAEVERHEKKLKGFRDLKYGLDCVLGKGRRTHGLNVSAVLPDECEHLAVMTAALVKSLVDDETKKHHENMKAI